MTDSTRVQGGLICAAVIVLALAFVAGLLQESYWALAVPVALAVAFVLGLTFWVGWTIATIRVEPEDSAEEPGDPAPAASPDADSN
ncbi:MAG: hypothetical protein JSU66_07050 [Deltaproteobacteria bacterium]|nr:MAG: hypothetical protein JSU66_07050 [Deltaproteobacteria bacterium]